MGDVWVRDTPFGPVTDSLKIADKFDMDHKHVLRAIKKCQLELVTQPKFGLCENIIKTATFVVQKAVRQSVLNTT
jgi:phage regulator Rha-like protein